MGRPGPDPTVSDEEIIRSIVAARPPALATTAIADKIGLSQQATARHLTRLEGDGMLSSEKMSGVNVWWPTADGRALLK